MVLASPAKSAGDPGEGCAACLMLIAAFFLLMPGNPLHDSIWGEHEGIIKTDDCREKVTVEEGSSGTWFKTFTCTYQKSKSGKLIGGSCQAVEMNDGGACQTVYSYQKKVL